MSRSCSSMKARIMAVSISGSSWMAGVKAILCVISPILTHGLLSRSSSIQVCMAACALAASMRSLKRWMWRRSSLRAAMICITMEAALVMAIDARANESTPFQWTEAAIILRGIFRGAGSKPLVCARCLWDGCTLPSAALLPCSLCQLLFGRDGDKDRRCDGSPAQHQLVVEQVSLRDGERMGDVAAGVRSQSAAGDGACQRLRRTVFAGSENSGCARAESG